MYLIEITQKINKGNANTTLTIVQSFLLFLIKEKKISLKIFKTPLLIYKLKSIKLSSPKLAEQNNSNFFSAENVPLVEL